jgi:signal transduction histidine kinase
MRTGVPQPIHLCGSSLGGRRHVCGFFDGPEDEYAVTVPFVLKGLELKELAFHIVDPALRAGYARGLEQHGIPLAELEKSGQFELRTWPETYLRGGAFDPDRMLAFLDAVLKERRPRFPRVRFVAHMNFPNAPQQTWDDWVAYEARLNHVLPKYPDPILCAYDTSKYGGALMIDLLRTHPMVILDGVLRANPSFVPPDEFLARLGERIASRAESSGPDGEQVASVAGEQKRNLDMEDRVLAMVSHELRNPLSAITVGATVLKEERRLTQDAVRFAAQILTSAKRMERIIANLLDLTTVRLTGGIQVKLTPTDAHELCARMVDELLMGHPGREIRLLIEGEAKGRWDASGLEQLVSNLVANALEYGREDTVVTVVSEGSATHWTVSVHNQGKPIPSKLMRQLFEPFRDVSAKHPGGGHLGIGLVIVREVVQAHGGTIEVISEAGKGTRFVARLPKG